MHILHFPQHARGKADPATPPSRVMNGSRAPGQGAWPWPPAAARHKPLHLSQKRLSASERGRLPANLQEDRGCKSQKGIQ